MGITHFPEKSNGWNDIINIKYALIEQSVASGTFFISDLNLHIFKADIDSCVIAEGVEQMDQIKMLKDYGCGQIQGYVFDKPLKKSEFEERMKRKKYD